MDLVFCDSTRKASNENNNPEKSNTQKKTLFARTTKNASVSKEYIGLKKKKGCVLRGSNARGPRPTRLKVSALEPKNAGTPKKVLSACQLRHPGSCTFPKCDAGFSGFQVPPPCEGLPLGHLTKTSRALHTGRSHPAWPRRLPLTPLVRLGRVKLVEQLGPKKRKRMTAPGFEPGSSGSQPLMLTTTPCHHVRVSGLGKNLWPRCFTGKTYKKKELSVSMPGVPPPPAPKREPRGTDCVGRETRKAAMLTIAVRTRNQRMCHRENTVFATQEQKKNQFGHWHYLTPGHFRERKTAKKIDVQQSKKRIKKASPRRDSNPQPPDPKSDTLSIAPRGPP